MITTARIIRTTIQQESGKVLVLALILLVMGSLILTPLLGLMSTGLHAGRTYDIKAAELYAADAGVEAAIHWLMNGKQDNWGWVQPEPEEKVWIRDDADRLHINGKYVTVTVEELAAANTFKVTSRITGPEPGTTVMSTLWAINIIQGCVDIKGPKTTFEGDVLITEDMTVTVGGQVDGNLVIGGDLTMEQQSELTGDVTVTGDATMNQSTIITGNICVGGDLTLEQSASITGDVWVGGHLFLDNSATILSPNNTVIVEGNVTITNGAQITGDMYVGGNLDLYGNCSFEGRLFIGGDITIHDKGRVGRIGGQDHVYVYGDIIITLDHPNAEVKGVVYGTGAFQCTGHNNRTCPTFVSEEWEDYISPPAYPDCPDIPLSPTKIYTYEIS